MTSQKDQIQTLIAEIDQVLQKASPRLPWVMSGDAAQQRRVLERVRAYLVSLQKTATEDSLKQARTRQNLSAYDIQYQPNKSSPAPVTPRGDLSQQDAARQLLQVVAQEIDGLRANLMQPLQSDIEALRQQRESLTQEVRQLEAQRHHYSLAQQQANQQQIISEFLQILMVRLQDSLAQQVAQTLSSLDSQALTGHGASPALGSFPSALDPAQRLEQLQTLQARSDQLLINLDSTLRVVFEALQRNVKSYQESLSQGLERMHDLGQQGEVMFTALVNHLAQQLGREASSYLQSSLQLPSLEATAKSSAPNLSPPVPEPEPPSDIEIDSTLKQYSPIEQAAPPFSNVNADLGLPYPGAELPLESATAETTPDHELEALNLEDLDLSNLNLSEDETDSEIGTLLNLDLSDLDLEASEDPASVFSSSSGTSNPAFAISNPELPSPVNPSPPTAKGEPSEITSEFDFLQQLSVDPDTEISDVSPEVSTSETTASSPTDGLAELDLAPDDQTEPPHDELDEFYASLFGPTPGEEAPFDSVEAVTDLEAVVPATSTDDLDFADVAQQENLTVESLTSPPENLPIAPSSEDSIAAIAPAVEDALFGDFESTAEPENTSPPASRSININEINAEPLESIDELLFSNRPELPDVDLVRDLSDLDNGTSDSASQPVEELRGSSSSSEIIEDLDATGFTTLEDAFVEDWQSNPADTTPIQQAEDIPSPNQNASELSESVVDLTFNDFSSPDIAASSADDSYIPAAPEESLLASQESTEIGEANLWVDEDIFQQLHEDLFSLEGIESDRAATLDDTDFTLAAFEHELNQEAPPSAPPPPAEVNEDLNSLTLEDFAEILPDPEVRPNAPEDLNLPSNESPLAEEPEFETRPRDSAAADLMMLDSFDDLFAEIPFEESPAAADEPFPPPPSSQPKETKLTGIDTQSMTLEDAFGSFAEADPESDGSDLGDSLAQLEDWNLDQNEKKKI